MLRVGREIGIQSKVVVCRHCDWEDLGKNLSAGLVWIERLEGYLYVYRCPACVSIDLAYKGKVLPFRLRPTPNHEQSKSSDPELNLQDRCACDEAER